MIDDCVSWKYHISYICSQISRNIGIISKLRHYLSIKQLKQIYYNLIYPYIAYAILAWGSTYTSFLQKVQVKQNHVARLIFFANMRGKDTESALPLLNLLDMLTVYNIYSLHVLKFAHLWHKGLLPDVFRNTFEYASEVHGYNTRYATQKNLYKPRVRTNTGKQMISSKAIDLWKSVLQNLKDLNVYTFSKNIKNFLLSKQYWFKETYLLKLSIISWLVHCTSIISYFTTIIIFNDVFFRFRPPFVSSPVSNVTSIGNLEAN